MKRRLNILIVVCVLLIASSVKAKDRPTLSNNQNNVDMDGLEKLLFEGIEEIQVFDKQRIKLYFEGSAGKIGLDGHKLTNYLMLKVKNNFNDIKIENNISFDKYTSQQIGRITARVWTLGYDYPIVYYQSINIRNNITCTQETLGYGSRDTVPDKIRENIASMIESLAITFYKLRGEL